MPNYWPSRSVLRWMSVVRNREIRNMWCYLVLSVYCWHVFCFGFLYRFDVCMIEKTTVLVICIHKRVKSNVFAVSIKFCDESGLAILNTYMKEFNAIFILCHSLWKKLRIICMYKNKRCVDKSTIYNLVRLLIS